MKNYILPILALCSAMVVAAPAQADVAVRLVGTASANDFSNLTPAQVQVIDDFFADASLANGRAQEDFLCYVLPLQDLTSGVTIGAGADCLRIFGAPDDATPGVSAPAISPMIDAVTFFFLPGGHFTGDGMTTVRPFFAGIGDAGGDVTHLTGSIPARTGPDSIVDGSGEFTGTRGNVRLSGAVDLSNFFTAGNPIFFTCLFVADFDPASTLSGRTPGELRGR